MATAEVLLAVAAAVAVEPVATAEVAEAVTAVVAVALCRSPGQPAVDTHADGPAAAAVVVLVVAVVLVAVVVVAVVVVAAVVVVVVVVEVDGPVRERDQKDRPLAHMRPPHPRPRGTGCLTCRPGVGERLSERNKESTHTQQRKL